MSNFRLDRALTVWCAAPLVRGFGLGQTGRLPILMYHSISNRAETDLHPYFRVVTAPEVFARQMNVLREWGYRGIALEDALSSFQNGGEGLANAVVITFDDGLQDFLTAAAPVLGQCGFSATVFLPSGLIGTVRREFKGTACLTWDEVQSLRRDGIRFGSHTVSHAKLYDLEWDLIEQELKESKMEIEQALGEPVTTFAYPYAYPQADREFTGRFEEMLIGTGYSCNATTRLGRSVFGSSPYRLRRLPVNGDDDPALLRAKIQGAYDWLAWPQAASKRLRRKGRDRALRPASPSLVRS